MRIALLVVLGFAGLWFSALRPRPAEVAPIEPPVVNAQPKAAAGAKAKKADPAPAKAEAAKAEAAKADPAPAAKPAPAKPAPAPAKTAAKPAPALSPVDRVLADVKAGRTTVLLFWNRDHADDRAVRQSVAEIDRRGGKVRVHVAPIGQVGSFDKITRGVPVVTSPTVLVIDGKGKARTVGGFTVTAELDELVAETLR